MRESRKDETSNHEKMGALRSLPSVSATDKSALARRLDDLRQPRMGSSSRRGVEVLRLDSFDFPAGLTFGIELEMTLPAFISDDRVRQVLQAAGAKGWK
jgi:hypothetical protein